MRIKFEKNILNKIPEGYGELFIYVPAKKEIVMISEGSGDNLLIEDIQEGYIDYIYYDQYTLECGITESDGGMVMLKEYFQDKYKCTADCVKDVLDMAYEDTELDYIILK